MGVYPKLGPQNQTKPSENAQNPPVLAELLVEPPASERGDAVAVGFAMTLGVWLVAYLCRVPMIQAPGPVTMGLMLAAVLAGGFVAGRYTRRGIRAGLVGGAVSGLLDLLIVGSIFRDIRASHPEYATGAAILMWVLGSVALNAVLAGLGAWVGALSRADRTPTVHAKSVFAWALAAETLALITAGGLVTSWGAGLAVPDWPNSYGYNMFLFPLSQMHGGRFYEHAHRLMGTLVGLTSLALAIYLSVSDARRWVKTFAWAIFACVCVQGFLGGMRVTGHPTTSVNPADMAPSTTLAIVHGVFAQVVFAAMCCLAAACSRLWESPRPAVAKPIASTDYAFTASLAALTLLQLTLGALLRHKDMLLVLHVTNSAFVAMLALAAGIRAWGFNDDLPRLQRAGVTLMAVTFVQLLLGVVALAVRVPLAKNPTPEHAIATTLHQANGAIMLASGAVLAAWTRRLLSMPETAPSGEAVAQPAA